MASDDVSGAAPQLQPDRPGRDDAAPQLQPDQAGRGGELTGAAPELQHDQFYFLRLPGANRRAQVRLPQPLRMGDFPELVRFFAEILATEKLLADKLKAAARETLTTETASSWEYSLDTYHELVEAASGAVPQKARTGPEGQHDE